ncbi:MAG TPA: hypothetical protein PKE45_05855, partial [Caldilineaceae bacterium]|nr:hypothetical protein [Caldilineaceae bacterium]
RRRDDAVDVLLERFHALTFIIYGLADYIVGEYADAEDGFGQALKIAAWDNTEVIYVMLGNAALKQKLFGDAEEYYRLALEKNDKYSRAYVGWGSALYGKAQDNGEATDYSKIDRELLNQSIDTYQRALEPGMDRPPLADVEAKANLGLGQVHLLRALVEVQAAQLDAAQQDWKDAEQGFRRVISAYADGENQRLQEHAAHAHARLGLIFRFT